MNLTLQLSPEIEMLAIHFNFRNECKYYLLNFIINILCTFDVKYLHYLVFTFYSVNIYCIFDIICSVYFIRFDLNFWVL